MQPAHAANADLHGPARWLAGLALGVALMGGAAQAQPGKLRVAVPTTLGAPLVDWEEQQPRGGALVAMVRHVAELRGLRLELVALPAPRLRAALQAGEVDAVCGLDAQRSAERDLLEWTVPWLESVELLVGHAGVGSVDQVQDVRAEAVVGAVQSLGLPAVVEGRLGDGGLRREDALSEDRLARKLAARRHPYAVLGQSAFSYWRAQGADMAAWALPLDRLRLQCGISRRGAPLTPQQWNDALDAARQSGLAGQWARQALQPGYAVVVSRQNEWHDVPEQQLIDLYLGRRATLGSGPAPRLLMLGGSRLGDVTRLLLKREPGDFAAQWSAQQFGGRRRGPESFDDPLLLRASLARDPQAMGVLPLWAVDGSVRILALR
jgi:ABC-type amino acid transport substrate-binding protein